MAIDPLDRPRGRRSARPASRRATPKRPAPAALAPPAGKKPLAALRTAKKRASEKHMAAQAPADRLDRPRWPSYAPGKPGIAGQNYAAGIP